MHLEHFEIIKKMLSDDKILKLFRMNLKKYRDQIRLKIT